MHWRHKKTTMKFPSGVTFESSVTSLLHSLPQNQQSRSDSIVSLLQHTSQDCSAVYRSSAKSTEVVRILLTEPLTSSFNSVSPTSHINHFKFQNADAPFQRIKGESYDVDGCCSRLYPFCTRSSTCLVHRDTTSLRELSKFIVDRFFTSRLCPLWPRSEDPGYEES
jgi:hypothetical protein